MVTRPVIGQVRRLPPVVEAALDERFEVRRRLLDATPSPGDLVSLLQACDGLLCSVADPLPAGVLEAPHRRTRIVANFGAGVNHIDLAAARRLGIVVTNTPDQLTEATADLTITLILMTLRRTGEGERLLRAGRWEGWRPVDLLGHDVQGRRLGLVGFGRIGQAVARRAALGFGMEVRYTTRTGRPHPPELAACAARAGSLEELLGWAEIVSLHLPATAESVRLFDAARLRAMRRGAWLINTSRGTIVDEAALVKALRDGHLAGAGLDVFEAEPAVTPALLELPDVVTLPHMGSATWEARTAMGMRAVANLDAFFGGRALLDPVVSPGAESGNS